MSWVTNTPKYIPPVRPKAPIVRVTPAEEAAIRLSGKHLSKGQLPHGATPFNKETGAAAIKRRWDAARLAAQEGMIEAVNEANEKFDKFGTSALPKLTTPPEAFKYIIKHATDVYLLSHSPKGLSDLGGFIGKSTGLVKDVTDMREEQSVDPSMLGIDDAKVILNVFNIYNEKKKYEGEVVDANAV
jgi:hypothetical protein